jgi:hypothetical protein
VATRSKAWNVSARSNTGIVGSNPTQGMDVSLYLFCVYVYVADLRRADPPSKESTDCLRFRNCSETKRFTDALCSSGEQQDEDDENNVGLPQY